MPAPEPLSGWRVVASPAALDAARWPEAAVVMRFAPDEALVLADDPLVVDDPHAVIQPEEGFCGVRLARADLEDWLGRTAEWSLPASSTSFTQGSAAGLAVKVWVEGDRALLVARASLAADLAERL